MSKRDFLKFVKDLPPNELQEQLIDLYGRFPEVKKYYDFIFNPQEDKLVEQAKIKIGKEYFPQTKRRPKKRRSVAQKLIKQYKTLEMDPMQLGDVMLFNIEIALTYTVDHPIEQLAFYKSMLTSYKDAVQYLTYHGVKEYFEHRIQAVVSKTHKQGWPNAADFEFLLL